MVVGRKGADGWGCGKLDGTSSVRLGADGCGRGDLFSRVVKGVAPGLRSDL